MAARSHILQDQNLLERATCEVLSQRRELGPKTGNKVKLVLCEEDTFSIWELFMKILYYLAEDKDAVNANSGLKICLWNASL